MQIYRSPDALPFIPYPVVTMGSFDGVHAGHRVIIRRLNELAGRAGGASVLVTFHPHPRKVLYPQGAGKELRLISTLEERCQLLEDAGLDHLLIMEFTKEFSLTSPEDYIRTVLLEKLHAHTIVVGFNHYFGHNKEGNFEALYEMSKDYGFRVEEIPEQEIQHETVSSTKIRKALKEGNIQRANAHLEHHFLIKAKLWPGENYSRALIADADKLIPPEGAYAASVGHREEWCKSLVRIVGRELIIYPLEGLCTKKGEKVCVHFQKHLSKKDSGDLEGELKEVEELIF